MNPIRNRSMMTSLTAALALAAATPAMASKEVGNGGDAVVCPLADGSRSARMLDYVEAERRGIHIDLGPPDLTVREKVFHALARLERLSPRRQADYVAIAERVLQGVERYETEKALPMPTGGYRYEATLFSDGDLVDVPDSDHSSIPPGCEVRQLVIYRPQVDFPEDRSYEIDRKLWDLLDADNKAGAVLHEVVYSDAIRKYKPQNSRGARYFNSKISSRELENMTLQAFTKLVSTADLQEIELNGVRLWAWTTTFSPSTGRLLSAEMSGTDEIQLQKGNVRVSLGIIEFGPDGSFSRAQVKRVTLPGSTGFRSRNDMVPLHPNGAPQHFFLGSNIEVPLENGSKVILGTGMRVRMDAEGRTSVRWSDQAELSDRHLRTYMESYGTFGRCSVAAFLNGESWKRIGSCFYVDGKKHRALKRVLRDAYCTSYPDEELAELQRLLASGACD